MILAEIFAVLAFLLLPVAYRIRGGGFITFRSTTVSRLVWCAALSLGYFLISFGHTMIYFLVSLPITAYLSMLVPHGFCQNMGDWPVPQDRWAGELFPNPWRGVTAAEWLALPLWKRRAHDFIEMMSVACFRGLIVFLPAMLIPMIYSAFVNGPDLILLILERFGPVVALAIITITLMQPLGYLLGKYTDFTVTGSLKARTAEWGEFYNGLAWVFALLIMMLAFNHWILS